jgi:hypothetical protein
LAIYSKSQAFTFPLDTFYTLSDFFKALSSINFGGKNYFMRKLTIIFLAFVVILVSLPFVAEAQTCRRKIKKAHPTRYYRHPSRYQVLGYSAERRPGFYRRHRNLINMGIGTAGGAVIGGLIGGRRGAGWGALAGLGSSALYTYKIKPKKRYIYYR